MSWKTKSREAQTTPPITSLAPLTNFVRECTTTWAPSWAGDMIMGVNVLSTTRVAPRSRASRPRAGMSATLRVGLPSTSV